jgi:outer membrane protein assembly factor BamA
MRLRAFAAVLMMMGMLAAAPDPIVKAIVIVGDPVVTVPALLAHLDVRLGMRYSEAVREKDAEALRNFYESQHLALGQMEGGIDPLSVDSKSDTATVKYAIYAARVAAVRITCNANVNEAVVFKQLRVRPGMLLNSELVNADRRRLRATGEFRSVNVKVEPGPNPERPQGVTLVWVLST